MICRSKKSAAAKGRVLFINAVKEVTRKNGESYLEPAHIKKIVDAYRNRLSDGILAYDATKSEIAGNGYKLSIPRYVVTSETTDQVVDIDEAIRNWNTSDRESESALTNLLEGMR